MTNHYHETHQIDHSYTACNQFHRQTLTLLLTGRSSLKNLALGITSCKTDKRLGSGRLSKSDLVERPALPLESKSWKIQ